MRNLWTNISLALDQLKKPLYNFYRAIHAFCRQLQVQFFMFLLNNGISFGNPQTTYISPEILVDKAFSQVQVMVWHILKWTLYKL